MESVAILFVMVWPVSVVDTLNRASEGRVEPGHKVMAITDELETDISKSLEMLDDKVSVPRAWNEQMRSDTVRNVGVPGCVKNTLSLRALRSSAAAAAGCWGLFWRLLLASLMPGGGPGPGAPGVPGV